MNAPCPLIHFILLSLQGAHHEAEVSRQLLQQLTRVHLQPQVGRSKRHPLLERAGDHGEVRRDLLLLPWPQLVGRERRLRD